MPEEDDDTLDGCDINMNDPATNTPDAVVDALVLFADVDFEDPEAVAARVAEWEALRDV